MPATDAERETIDEFIAEHDATRVGAWSRVQTPDPDLASFDNEVLAEWNDETDRIAVFIERGEFRVGDRGGEPYYSAGATATGDFRGFESKSIERRAELLDTALDAAIDYMERTDPGEPLPTFSLRISGGILDPLTDFLSRFGGGKARWTVFDSGIHVESTGFNRAADFEIPAADVEAFDVEREGAFSIGTSALRDRVKNFGRTDVIPMALDADEESPRLGIGPLSERVSLAADYTERDFPEPEPSDFQFTAGGLNFRDVSRFIDDDIFETVVIGVTDGIAIMHGADEDTGEEATARFDTSAVSGAGLVTVNNSAIADIRRVDPRFSETDVTITAKFGAPLLAELSVDGTGVDVRAVLADEAVPVDIRIPPAEITPPDEVEEATKEVPEEPEPEAEPRLTPGAIETIVDEATVGVNVRSEVVGDRVRQLTLRLSPDPPVRFAIDADQVTIVAEDDPEQTVRKAILRWSEITELDSLSDEQVEDINERRRALNEQFDIFLSPLEVTLAGEVEADGFTAGEIEEIVTRSTAGVFTEVTINPDIGSLRITFSDDPRTSVEFDRTPEEVQGVPTDPVGAINEALQEWKDAVDTDTVSMLAVSREREAVEEEFDIDLLSVVAGRPVERPEPVDIEIPPPPEPAPQPEAPEFDLSEPLTADLVQDAFPRLFESQGNVFASEFDTLESLITAPVGELLTVRGIGEGTVRRMIDERPPDPGRSIAEQRERPLGIEERRVAAPDDGFPPGEEWLLERIEESNRVTQNSFLVTGVVELVFPERMEDTVRAIVITNDIAPAGPQAFLQAPSFRDQLPAVAADLLSVQFLLNDPNFADLRSTGYDVRSIMRELADRPVVALVSPRVRASVSFN